MLGFVEGIVLEFSLTDRGGFNYPALLGRGVMSGHITVDTATSYCIKVRLRVILGSAAGGELVAGKRLAAKLSGVSRLKPTG